MHPMNQQLTVFFKHSGEQKEVALAELVSALTTFLDQYGVKALVGEPFHAIVGDGDGESKWARLLSQSGYKEDPSGFCRQLLDRLGRADGTEDIRIGGVGLPPMLLVAILEIIHPGNRFITIKTVAQLEKVTHMRVHADDRTDMQAVIDTYPVRLSMHTVRQMRVSRHVAYQYLPFTEELDDVGHTNTWIGQFHQGLLEQMYQNRVIFLLNMSCPVYCRFCFRKHKESRNTANPTVADVRQAVAHVAASPAVKEVVITGGDPFLNRANMAAAIDGLVAVDHVQTLRLATRSIAYYPHLFLENDEALLGYLKDKNRELRQTGKRMEVATHFIHPDEISPQSLRIICDLVKNGIAVYIQTPFLNDCNDKGPELVKLFSLLRGAGAELHYIYIPCSPIHGNSIYWTPIAKGLAAGNYLRAHLSDRVIPRICTATPIGKMDWHSSGWAVEPVEGQEDFIWIRSPYTPQYFKEFAPLAKELDNLRVNAEGTIDVQYMARLGDDTLFLGARPPRRARTNRRSQADNLGPLAQQYDRPLPSIVTTGAQAIARLHETRVEIDAAEMNADLAYIRADERITDVVVWTANDIAASLARIEHLIKNLRKINHVNAVRLRSLAFNYAPQTFDRTLIDTLASLNHLSVVHPLRLEIETQFLTADEFLPAHRKLTGQLNSTGITVYNNTPLLGGINDTPSAIHALAYQCRQAGIEFHHLYVAGMPLQVFLNQDHPVSLYDVVDIATQVRREGSGREIPRYILRTPLGEVDFGLTATFVSDGDKLAVKLLPYELSYFQAMDPDFSWPQDVRTDETGRPIVCLKGVRKETDFALS